MQLRFLLRTLSYSIAVLAIASCSGEQPAAEGHGEDHAVHWGYETSDGPAVWGSMNPDWALCAQGVEQSPIDLANATQIELSSMELDLVSGQELAVLNQAGVIDALDNGHTIQINAETGETLTVGDKSYALVQFHFHAPSEHTVNGKHYPMELHFVHAAQDGALAVLGVLLDEGATNPGIAPLWSQLTAAPSATTIRMPTDFAENIFPDVGAGFYHYDGSLTTPPCSEGVKWYVRKTPTTLSKQQIATFAEVYDHNNRPVQALNERALYLDEKPKLVIH
jgi:carbonic anhydrase